MSVGIPITNPRWRPDRFADDTRRPVHIVTGSFGAGHDAAAREVAIRFRERGYATHTWDIVDLFPAGLGPMLRWAYLRQLSLLPGSWEVLLHGLSPDTRLHRAVRRALMVTATPLLELATGRPDLIVSTHPFASQALGKLRMDGRLESPVVTYLTDMSVHPLWVHPGVDLHLALHDIPANQARQLGGRAAVVEPLVPPTYPSASGLSRSQLRQHLGLPLHKRLALVTGGSHGIGQLASSAKDIRDSGLAVPVVLCGDNSALRRRLDSARGVLTFGWRNDMPDVLRAVDCVVQNAGGFTSLEALAAGVPTLSYRCIPGHGRTNAQALDDAGLIPWARTLPELHRDLVEAFGGRLVPSRQVSRPDIVDLLFPEWVDIPA